MNTLLAVYDLAIGPVSFDFLVFMVKAEIERRRVGAARLHVVVVPHAEGVGGMFRDKTALYDEHEMRWRLWNIVMPLPQLFGASVTLATDWAQAKRIAADKSVSCWPVDWDRQSLKDRRHLIGDVITVARAGVQIPRVRASQHARRSVRTAYEMLRRPVVTMTVRSTYLAERNSDRQAWEEARRFIEGGGYAVVMLEDTRVALTRGQGFGELNLDLRAAMYQEAALNLQANNGAASLCWFSDRPYRMFGAGVPADEWNGLFVKQGLPLGETWPWAASGQKLVYGRESRDSIIAEFEGWRSTMTTTASAVS